MRGQESAMEERRVRVNRQWRPTLVGADQWNSIKMQMDFVPRRREQCETRRPLGRGAFQFLRSVFVLFCLVFVFFFWFFFLLPIVRRRFRFPTAPHGQSGSLPSGIFCCRFLFRFFFWNKERQPESQRKKERNKVKKKERKKGLDPSGPSIRDGTGNGIKRFDSVSYRSILEIWYYR